MPKKEESSNKQVHKKDEKIHVQKHEELKPHVKKAGEAGRDGSQGSGVWNSDEKEFGKVKGPGTEGFTEKGMGGSRGRGMEQANQPGTEDIGETSLGNTDGTGVGNFDGIDIRNFDPLASGGLGKKVAGKGCLSTIIGIILVLSLVVIF